MTSNFTFVRSLVGIAGALILAGSFVGVAVVPAYAAPIAQADAGTIAKADAGTINAAAIA